MLQSLILARVPKSKTTETEKVKNACFSSPRCLTSPNQEASLALAYRRCKPYRRIGPIRNALPELFALNCVWLSGLKHLCSKPGAVRFRIHTWSRQVCRRGAGNPPKSLFKPLYRCRVCHLIWIVRGFPAALRRNLSFAPHPTLIHKNCSHFYITPQPAEPS